MKRRQVKRLVTKLKRGRPRFTWRERDWLLRQDPRVALAAFLLGVHRFLKRRGRLDLASILEAATREWVDRIVDHETRGTSPHRAVGIFGTGEGDPT